MTPAATSARETGTRGPLVHEPAPGAGGGGGVGGGGVGGGGAGGGGGVGGGAVVGSPVIVIWNTFRWSTRPWPSALRWAVTTSRCFPCAGVQA
jgi:hypothetical protein